MISQIVACGAGEKVMEDKSNPIHEFILSLATTNKPKILFIPTASGDNEKYIDKFYKTYDKSRCKPAVLELFYREELDLRKVILEQDIIHVSGGNTANMMAVWTLHGVDAILREAWDMGKVFCGGSAGALCWFEGGVTDSFGEGRPAPFMDCLGLLEGSFCPHYDVDKNRKPAFHKFLLEELLPAGYAADDFAALHFEGKNLKAVVASKAGSTAYRVKRTGKTIHEEVLATTLLI